MQRYATMDKKLRDTAKKLFSSEYEKLTKQEKHVVHHITERTPISTNVIQEHSEQLTFGQKMADKVASFGGVLDIYHNIHGCAGYMDYSEFVHSN
jgi:hypothetical protein